MVVERDYQTASLVDEKRARSQWWCKIEQKRVARTKMIRDLAEEEDDG